MTEDKPHTGEEAAASPEELRRRVEATREELGGTVEALAAKTDVKTRAHERTADVRQRLAERTTQVREKAAQVGERARDKAPEPVRERAGQGVRMARSHRVPLFAVVGALIALLAVRRVRRRR
ncbi:DUF3618 domain-containing protein [Streptomyces sp. NPDC049687]|uniref:DUF3618 domain-containing protein n=1 Tax=Streptomyces sp. NPDC049687 TaxID=3365596 RepID=UPI0037B314CD